MTQRPMIRDRSGWYVADWTPIGWAETIIKLVAHAFAGIALIYALLSGTYVAPEGGRFVEVAILAFLSLGLTIAIFDRFLQREIVAMLFAIVNNIAHWGMVYALLTQPGPGLLLPIFALLMLIGDIIKLRFLAVTDFILHTYPGVPRWIPFFFVGIFIVGYTLLILIGFGTP
jgi:hypothetical protein